MRSRKGFGFLVQKTFSIIFVVLFILVAGTIIFGLAASAPGKIAEQLCEKSLATKIEVSGDVNSMVGKFKKDAHIDSIPYKWEGVGTGYNAVAFVGNLFTGGIRHDTNKAVEGAADMARDAITSAIPVMCGTTTSSCVKKADGVARCIYKKTANSYYALYVGLPAGLDEVTLYEVYADVTGPGTIPLRGDCKDYFLNIDPANAIELPDGSLEYVPGKKNLNFKNIDMNFAGDVKIIQTPGVCNFTFNTVTRTTMGLTMISDCQFAPNGPEDSSCFCFANPDMGHGTGNGLPLCMHDETYVDTGGLVRSFQTKYHLVTYTGFPPDLYKGCGNLNPEVVWKMGSINIQNNVRIVSTCHPIKWGDSYREYYAPIPQYTPPCYPTIGSPCTLKITSQNNFAPGTIDQGSWGMEIHSD